jgi:hypothetical protein
MDTESNIPKNLKECIDKLDNILSEENKQSIKKMSEYDFTIDQHFGLAMDLRNAWGLWSETSPLVLYLKKSGVLFIHPDDISGDILSIYYKHLKGEKIDFNNPLKAFYGKDLYEKKIKADEIKKMNITDDEKEEKILELFYPDEAKRNKAKKHLKQEFKIKRKVK